MLNIDNVQLQFRRINNIKYYTEVPEEVTKYVDNIMSNISAGLLTEYDDYLNREIEDKLYSRIVSSIFFRDESSKLSSYGFNTIDISIKGKRVITASLGKLPVAENEDCYVCGVMYK